MSIARSGHTSTLLSNGDVLVIGGWNVGAFQSGAELYHPDTGIFETIDDFPVRISAHTETLLNNGRIFVYGMGAAIYNPETKKFERIIESDEDIIVAKESEDVCPVNVIKIKLMELAKKNFQ